MVFCRKDLGLLSYCDALRLNNSKRSIGKFYITRMLRLRYLVWRIQILEEFELFGDFMPTKLVIFMWAYSKVLFICKILGPYMWIDSNAPWIGVGVLQLWPFVNEET